MNLDNRYHVSPSFFTLREVKNRQDQVNRGYQMLKRKAEALQSKLRQATSELTSLQTQLGHSLKEAYITLAAIKFTNGESNALVLENIGEAQLRVQRIPENISGVTIITLQAVEDPTVSDTLQYAGLGAGGHRTAEAKKAFREALNMLMNFASLRNTCILLDAAAKSTLRKIKGIEKVILPKLRSTESYIITEIDEREREEFHRLKMVKAKKIQISLTSTPLPISTGDRESDDGNNSFDKPSRLRPLSSYKGLTQPYTLMMCGESSNRDKSSDYPPTCLPSNWDDDEILF